MTTRVPVLLAATLLAALIAVPGPALGRAVRPALAPEPNTSIILYKPPASGKPGRALVGTLVNGVFTRKGAFSTRRWTSIAVGRDSMALYDRTTGKLLTGRFRNGIWRPVKSRTIAKGYTDVVASCDSIMFYKRSTDTGKTAEFTSGDIRDMRDMIALSVDDPLLAASCDTLLVQGVDASDQPRGTRGWLRDGRFQRDSLFGGDLWTHLAANQTSFLRIDDLAAGGSPVAQWGTLRDGDANPGGSADVTAWDVVAGVGDGMMFYLRSNGLTWGWRIFLGVQTDTGPIVPNPPKVGLGAGWRIIAGGK